MGRSEVSISSVKLFEVLSNRVSNIIRRLEIIWISLFIWQFLSSRSYAFFCFYFVSFYAWMCAWYASCFCLIFLCYVFLLGASCWWHSWLRHCAESRKVAGSIPDGVIGIFHWHKSPSDRTMALGSTQPLTEISIKNISWGLRLAWLAVNQLAAPEGLCTVEWESSARSCSSGLTINATLHRLLSVHTVQLWEPLQLTPQIQFPEEFLIQTFYYQTDAQMYNSYIKLEQL